MTPMPRAELGACLIPPPQVSRYKTVSLSSLPRANVGDIVISCMGFPEPQGALATAVGHPEGFWDSAPRRERRSGVAERDRTCRGVSMRGTAWIPRTKSSCVLTILCFTRFSLHFIHHFKPQRKVVKMVLSATAISTKSRMLTASEK